MLRYEPRWERFPAVAGYEWARRWLTMQANRMLARNTIDSYSRSMEDFLRFVGRQGVSPESATREHVAEYLRNPERTLSDPTYERREQIMPAEWLDFKSIKGKVSMETVLSHYDVRLRRVGADEFRGKCPLPTHSSTSSNDSFSVSFTRNAWSCQSASCIAARSGRLGGNVFDFVAEMERCSIREAALHLQHSLAENLIPRATSRSEESAPYTPENRPLSFTLRNIDHRHPYVASRGLSERTARYFGVGYYNGNGFLRERVVIPIHNEHGELVAYSGRAIDQTEPKYRLPAGFRKSHLLFNLHRAIQKGSRTFILVEGFFDTFKIHQAGHHNVAALMGSKLSDRQAKLIGTYFDQVILMLDTDEAGKAATAAAGTALSSILEVQIVELASGTQPDQLASEEINQLLGDFAHDVPTPDR